MAVGLHTCAANNAVHLVTAAGTLHFSIASALRHQQLMAFADDADQYSDNGNSDSEAVDRIASICILALQMLFRAHHRAMFVVTQRVGKSIGGRKGNVAVPPSLLDGTRAILARAMFVDRLASHLRVLVGPDNLPSRYFHLSVRWAFDIPRPFDVAVTMQLDTQAACEGEMLWAMRRSMSIVYRNGVRTLIDDGGNEFLAVDDSALEAALDAQILRPALSIVLAYVKTIGYSSVEIVSDDGPTIVVAVASNSHPLHLLLTATSTHLPLRIMLTIPSSSSSSSSSTTTAIGNLETFNDPGMARQVDLRTLQGRSIKEQLMSFV